METFVRQCCKCIFLLYAIREAQFFSPTLYLRFRQFLPLVWSYYIPGMAKPGLQRRHGNASIEKKMLTSEETLKSY